MGVYYNHRTGVRIDKSMIMAVKIALVLLGALIGASLGLWVAVKTIPLPYENVIYQVQGQ